MLVLLVLALLGLDLVALSVRYHDVAIQHGERSDPGSMAGGTFSERVSGTALMTGRLVSNQRPLACEALACYCDKLPRMATCPYVDPFVG